MIMNKNDHFYNTFINSFNLLIELNNSMDANIRSVTFDS